MASRSLPVQLTKRTPLQDAIPLDTPYGVNITITDYCNLKCVFCAFCGPSAFEGLSRNIMPLDLYKKTIDQLAEFPSQLRSLNFGTRAEATLHKDLPKMISYAKEKDVAREIRLITNGVTLSPEYNKALIDSGLDYIRISVPGIDEDTCFKITGVKFDLDTYIQNIKHLYDNKSDNMTVYCKAVNTALGGEGGADPDPVMAEKFYTLFDDVCDYTLIENIVPLGQFNPTQDDLKNFGIENFEGNKKHMYGFTGDILDNELCEQIFYTLYISTAGNVYPCCVEEEMGGFLMGNVNQKSLLEIWNSDALKKLRIKLAKGETPEVCKGCSWRKYTNHQNLGKYADKILSKLLGGPQL